MLLVEQGKLRPSDPVARDLPAFAAKGKDKITVEQLLLHTSGLIPDNAVADYEDGREKAIQRICDLEPASAPGSRIRLQRPQLHHSRRTRGEAEQQAAGRILEGKPVHAARHDDDGLQAGRALNDRIAPTEKRDGKWLIGEVHDPRRR